MCNIGPMFETAQTFDQNVVSEPLKPGQSAATALLSFFLYNGFLQQLNHRESLLRQLLLASQGLYFSVN